MPRADRFGAAALFAVTFLLRWLTLDFDNDYFMHVAWAAEMVRGAAPVRDFVEPGFILQTLVSYAAFRAGGNQLVGEGIAACVLIAAGVALTFVVCRRIGIPCGIALVAALTAAAMYPRLYAYPKAFVYAAALWALVHYYRRPGRGALFLLSLTTAVAFLFRHDHGVWVGAVVVLSLALFHLVPPRGFQPMVLVRVMAGYGVVSLLLVAPWLAYAALSGHGREYFSFLTTRSDGLLAGWRLPEARLAFDPKAPAIGLAPIEYPKIRIRWSSAISQAEQREREARYGLQPIADDRDRYVLTNTDSHNVAALVLDPAVEDTAGVDRGALRAPAGLFARAYLGLQRYVPVVRVRVLPGVINHRNALPWLTWVTFAIPFVVFSIALTGAFIARHHLTDTWRLAATVMLPAAVLSVVTYQVLVRGSPDSRLGDIAAITAFLSGWLAWRAWTVRHAVRLLLKPVVAMLMAVTLAGAVSYGNLVPRLAGAGVDGPVNLVRRVRDVAELYAAPPLAVFAPPEARGLAALSRWLNTCTRPTDRVAVIGFEPQVYVIADRGFAGGLAFYYLAWNNSDTEQQLTIERWSSQDVPVVLALEYEWNKFRRDYPQVRDWIDERYNAIQRTALGGNKEVTVLVDRSRPPGPEYESTGLPCFTAAGTHTPPRQAGPRRG